MRKFSLGFLYKVFQNVSTYCINFRCVCVAVISVFSVESKIIIIIIICIAVGFEALAVDSEPLFYVSCTG